ncbi:MAG TPA: SMC-Scp complex subunit ScpB [Gammaproteobacteria bacterium]
MNPEKKIELRNIVEGALLAAGRPLNAEELLALFPEEERPDRAELRKALELLKAEFEGRGIELKEVASGYRIQVRQNLAPYMGRLWEERPARYSRALLETLALVAYRQPITRGEIEEVRGVTVSTHIIRTLQERGWIRIVGHRDVPGHPEMFGTTKEFLDYFSLKSLDELPTLAQLRDIESINAELDFGTDADPDAIPAQAAAPAPAPRLVEDGSAAENDGETGVTTH